MMLLILTFAILSFILSFGSFLVMIFIGSALSNLSEMMLDDVDENAESLLEKFSDLEREILNRLPNRTYGEDTEYVPDEIR